MKILTQLTEALESGCPDHVFPVDGYSVYDGDTIKATLDLSFYVSTRYSCRIAGVDTPEKDTAAGKAVTGAVMWWMRQIDRENLRCISLDRDKFGGRFVGTFFEKLSPESSVEALLHPETLSHWLLNTGLARPYDGGRKQPWTTEELWQVHERAMAIGKEDEAGEPAAPLKVFAE